MKIQSHKTVERLLGHGAKKKISEICEGRWGLYKKTPCKTSKELQADLEQSGGFSLYHMQHTKPIRTPWVKAKTILLLKEDTKGKD